MRQLRISIIGRFVLRFYIEIEVLFSAGGLMYCAFLKFAAGAAAIFAIAFRAHAVQFIPLGDFSEGAFTSGAIALSNNGTNVVAYRTPPDDDFHWTITEAGNQ